MRKLIAPNKAEHAFILIGTVTFYMMPGVQWYADGFSLSDMDMFFVQSNSPTTKVGRLSPVMLPEIDFGSKFM